MRYGSPFIMLDYALRHKRLRICSSTSSRTTAHTTEVSNSGGRWFKAPPRRSSVSADLCHCTSQLVWSSELQCIGSENKVFQAKAWVNSCHRGIQKRKFYKFTFVFIPWDCLPLSSHKKNHLTKLLFDRSLFFFCCRNVAEKWLVAPDQTLEDSRGFTSL